MLNKLEQIKIKFEKTEAELSSPEAVANQEKFRALMREHKKLAPIVEKFREYKKACTEEEDAELMLDEADDAEMKKMIVEEIAFQMLIVLKSNESAIKKVVTSLYVEFSSSILRFTECLNTGSHSPRFWLLAFISVASSIMTCFSS